MLFRQQPHGLEEQKLPFFGLGFIFVVCWKHVGAVREEKAKNS